MRKITALITGLAALAVMALAVPAGASPVSHARIKRYAYEQVRVYFPHQDQRRQFGCARRLFTRESRWDVTAYDHATRGYGIPQAAPGRRMASAGRNWRTDGRTQVRWAYGYVKHRYGSLCAAWRFWQQNNGY